MDWKSYKDDPILNEIEKEAVRYIRRWLVEKGSIRSSRQKFYDGLKISEHRNKSLTAFHEAGHIIMMWFSTLKVEILYASIDHTQIENTPPGRFRYLGAKEYFTADPENTKTYQFDSMCLYMGGIRIEQRYYPQSRHGILQCKRDIHNLCIKAYRLAKLTMDEVNIRDTKKLAHLYIRKSFEVATEILMKYKPNLKILAEELFLNGTVSHEDLLQILGPRPVKETSYYKEFVKGKMPRNMSRPASSNTFVEPPVAPETPVVPPKVRSVTFKTPIVSPKTPSVPPKTPIVTPIKSIISPKTHIAPPEIPIAPPKVPAIFPKTPFAPPKTPPVSPKAFNDPPKTSTVPPKYHIDPFQTPVVPPKMSVYPSKIPISPFKVPFSPFKTHIVKTSMDPPNTHFDPSKTIIFPPFTHIDLSQSHLVPPKTYDVDLLETPYVPPKSSFAITPSSDEILDVVTDYDSTKTYMQL